MGTPMRSIEPAHITIRKFRSGDERCCRRIFAEGMRHVTLDLWREAVRDALPVFTLLTALFPAIAFFFLHDKGLPLPALLMALTSATSIVPLLSMLFIFKSMKKYVAYCISDDLANIGKFYSSAGSGKGSEYFVAEEFDPKSGASTIVGTVALQAKDSQTAELRRMSVSKSTRGGGVGRLLANTLICHAKSAGFQRVILTTTSAQYSALRLYGRLGWVRQSSELMGGMRMIKLELDLEGREGEAGQVDKGDVKAFVVLSGGPVPATAGKKLA